MLVYRTCTLLVEKRFRRNLEKDGRTVSGMPVVIPAGTQVDVLGIGSWDTSLVRHTDPQGRQSYAWIYHTDLR